MRKLRLLLPVFVVLALALAACGGGDDGEEDQVIETIETSALSTDPADCTELNTLRFLEQTQFRRGKAALRNCVYHANNPDANPNDVESVEVSNVEIEGSEATADVAMNGGGFDGQTLTVAVVEEDDNWKMDEITGFAEFDQESLVESFERQFSTEGVEQEVLSCVGEELNKLPRQEFEKAMIGGDPTPFIEVVGICSQG